VDGGLVGFLEQGLVDGVVFNDIYEVGGDLAVDLHEFVGVFGAVVKSFKEDIFKRDLIPGPFVEIVQRFDECLDVVCLVDGHDLVAFLVVCGVEGQGQFEFDLIVAELADHLGHAGGGNGNAARAHGKTVSGGDAFDGFQHIAVVQQRLSHAHENNITQLLFVCLLALLVDEDNLIVDLVEFEVSFPVHIAGRAEFAAQGAANLGRNTGGLAFVSRNEDTFDEVAIGGAEPAFDGAVAAELGGVDRKGREGEGVGEQLADRLAEIGHVFEGAGVFLPQPFADLFGTKLFFTEGFEEYFDLVVGQVSDIFLRLFHEGRKGTNNSGIGGWEMGDGVCELISKADRRLY
jgi:hypothetical protein